VRWQQLDELGASSVSSTTFSGAITGSRGDFLRIRRSRGRNAAPLKLEALTRHTNPFEKPLSAISERVVQI
jgi:hypothetical protein